VISTSKIGCHIGVIAVNIFAYADDVVLLAASWQAMQGLGLAVNCCKDLDLECNAKKMKCMVVNPSDSSKIVSSVFPRFMINGLAVEFVQEFGYLGHILSCMMRDDSDIKREIRNVYMRTNMLTQRYKPLFHKCKDKNF